MIVLDLICSAGHRFEGWFASVEAFDAQTVKQLVNCTHCNTADVRRLPSTPHLVKTGGASTVPDQSDVDLARFVEQLRRIADASEDVGDQFPEEARRIHYHEVPERQIRGQATRDETKELIDEGILVLPVPRKRETH
jgi:hypothetical protein